jgi:eukaryotic-like serine/threonine-protein kinase
VLGTPNYMSPEQVLGEKVDSRSDLFSAGVVLYQLLTGKLPFDGDSLISVAYKITKTEPPSLDKLRPDAPLGLRRIVERALKKQPEKRFQTGEEFAQALIGVAKEIAEEEERKGRGRRIPLGVRWAAMMAALVATTMAVTGVFLYRQQYAAMLDQVTGYGGSLAKFIATQNAVPLLSEDWTAIDVFIQAAISKQDFSYIVVQDDKGVIRGANDAARINQAFALPDPKPLPSHDPSVTVQGFRLPDGRDVLDFGAPIEFQNKTLGQVHLGIFQEPLTKVATLMIWLLGILTLVTTAAGAFGSFLLAQRLQGPIRVLRNSFAELAKGRYDYRIAEDRKDEFGELYAAFDKTAAALEERHEAAAPPAAK